MTKEKIESIVKRYKYIQKAINSGANEIIFYIGNRKQEILITEQVVSIYEIIEEVRKSIATTWIKRMIDGILSGDSDVWLISDLPCERSMYYNTKRKFIDNVYHCCIAKGMVPYEELLKEAIA